MWNSCKSYTTVSNVYNKHYRFWGNAVITQRINVYNCSANWLRRCQDAWCTGSGSIQTTCHPPTADVVGIGGVEHVLSRPLAACMEEMIQLQRTHSEPAVMSIHPWMAEPPHHKCSLPWGDSWPRTDISLKDGNACLSRMWVVEVDAQWSFWNWANEAYKDVFLWKQNDLF